MLLETTNAPPGQPRQELRFAPRPSHPKNLRSHDARRPIRVSVVIPTLNAEPHLARQIAMLATQTVPVAEVIVIDSSSVDATVDIATAAGCRVVTIPRREFDHGDTRNRAAQLAEGDVVIFMTQDALPSNNSFIEHLVQPIFDGSVAATYARQIAYPNATPPEQYARELNYPPTSHVMSFDDVADHGIKAFFFSNVASAVSRSHFDEVGGFPARTIMNEDMLLCSKLLNSGQRVGYCANAVVFHSHNYKLTQQFKRNFDIGAFVSLQGQQLGNTRAGKSGVNFALGQLRHLVQAGHWRWLPRTIADLAIRLVAYRLGTHQRSVPVRLKRLISMHAYHW